MNQTGGMPVGWVCGECFWKYGRVFWIQDPECLVTPLIKNPPCLFWSFCQSGALSSSSGLFGGKPSPSPPRCACFCHKGGQVAVHSPAAPLLVLRSSKAAAAIWTTCCCIVLQPAEGAESVCGAQNHWNPSKTRETPRPSGTGKPATLTFTCNLSSGATYSWNSPGRCSV